MNVRTGEVRVTDEDPYYYTDYKSFYRNKTVGFNPNWGEFSSTIYTFDSDGQGTT